MRMAMAALTAGTLGMGAVSADAAIVTDFVHTDTVTIDGTDYNVWEMRVDVETDWLLAALTIDLSAGTMYNHLFGGSVPPTPAQVGAAPDLAFDTFVMAPNGGSPGLNENILSDTDFFVSWYDSEDTGPGTYAIAQITLSTDAVGTVSGFAGEKFGENVLYHFFDGSPGATDTFMIRDGGFTSDIPEPATVALLGLGGLAMLGRRRGERG